MEDIAKRYPEALHFHKGGKIEVKARRSLETERELSLAYTPGVAVPVEVIRKDPLKAFEYTSKGHLVAVISNGTACLGLGNVGALACKPVMEGKAVLFKKFANIDAFDIEVNEKDPDKFVEIVKAIAPTFGGINLEDIRAPECFRIEERLKAELDIPVMHDDQHGTALISAAALINAVELTNKKMENLKVVVIGAGAAATSCTRIYKSLGVQEVVMFDSRGVIHNGRDDLNEIKKEFAIDTHYKSYKEALKGADVLLGLSKADLIDGDDIMEMNVHPMVFAMSNPVPEIMPEVAKVARPDVLMATGRSDYPNQINNVLGFPYIFKGALRVRASCINEPMKLAAAYALAELARKEVPHELSVAYGRKLVFGEEYLIPSAFDPRLNEFVSIAVAKAAVESQVSRLPL
ncbi:malate dehydrogenase [Helicobacter monodelphidis]|uniref:malic enzyme-like NAD(P)-binding protein n=1 Tax=Helicobacter sp. 15-1451 TaxID=2004995 RepID=UPI000DCEC4B3|nr:malic enzyme-like NAD(P)-binding protein [Helicobacter sp. 15-1451]RAX58592.1 malate dehydrogenase [Helicobacter sp. 15-1451]